jgi:hypothetical protein
MRVVEYPVLVLEDDGTLQLIASIEHLNVAVEPSNVYDGVYKAIDANGNSLDMLVVDDEGNLANPEEKVSIFGIFKFTLISTDLDIISWIQPITATPRIH